ncbi:MAG: hypothetical protein V4682_01180 [Patescibacteria group bacterium]
MNHTTQTILGTLVIIGFVMGALFLYERSERETPLSEAPAVESPAVVPSESVSIEEYVTKNISTLSPEPEQLGGTFYVTGIEAMEGSGTVYYEDGHNAYTADFTYTLDPLAVDSFVVRPL